MCNRKNKVAIILTGFLRRYIVSLIKLFNESEVEVHIFASNKKPYNYEDLAKVFYVDLNINVKDVMVINKYNEELKRVIKPEEYDYVLTDCLPLSFATNIFHCHSVIHRMKFSPNFIYKAFYYFGHHKLIKYFQEFNKLQNLAFVVSNLMKEDFSKNCNIGKDKVKVVYPGFEIPFDIKKSDNKLFMEGNSFVIGLCAVGFKTKGGYVLLDAIKNLKKDYPSIKAKIISPSYKKNFLLKLYLKLFNLEKNVELLGYQKNMVEFYNSIHCLVVPSLFESFGRVVTESMVYGVPVVVGSKTGAKDIIKDGENGFIFEMDKDSGKNLARKIEVVIDKYKQNAVDDIVLKSRDDAKNITWENFAKGVFEGLYPEKVKS